MTSSAKCHACQRSDLLRGFVEAPVHDLLSSMSVTAAAERGQNVILPQCLSVIYASLADAIPPSAEFPTISIPTITSTARSHSGIPVPTPRRNRGCSTSQRCHLSSPHARSDRPTPTPKFTRPEVLHSFSGTGYHPASIHALSDCRSSCRLQKKQLIFEKVRYPIWYSYSVQRSLLA